MRVVVNQVEALKQKTGIGHYTHQLLRCLRAQAGDDRIDAFPTGWVAGAWKGCAGRRKGDRRKGHGSPFASTLRRGCLALTGWQFRAMCRRQKYDLYHEPNSIPLAADCPAVATVHDLSLLLYPEWHPADRVAHFEQHFTRALGRCAHFLTDSECIRQQMIRALGTRPERVTRVYLGTRPGLRPLPEDEVAQTLHRLRLPARYLLSVGTIEPRKNVLLLLRAYCTLPNRLRAEWPLLLVGKWGWNAAEVADYLHAEARHRGVLHLGYVAEEHLPALYNGARALFYPSHYEGFGLPPLEMMACGGAVVASTAEALVETVGGQAQLVPADDLDGWRDAMARLVTDDDWWQFLRSGAEDVARPYTWEQCAADTLAVYRRFCDGERPEALPAEGEGRRLAG
ncbi:MAG TPA: glycosyltransferase family 1 protein [Gemmataceae bacterium]|jgi:alpha-1,3-rhamnosyl/mannosyltransferase|nr:glycosyltransferase family 1 protein [Gemmataceae bacterium]